VANSRYCVIAGTAWRIVNVKLFVAGDEEQIWSDHERTDPQLDQGCEYRIEVAVSTGVQDMKLQPEDPGSRL